MYMQTRGSIDHILSALLRPYYQLPSYPLLLTPHPPVEDILLEYLVPWRIELDPYIREKFSHDPAAPSLLPPQTVV